jgi:mRNA interferase MazF
MRKGDIVLIPFPFTDLSGAKNRPALLLINSDDDITVAFITSQLSWTDKGNIEIEPSSSNGLKKTSLIRLSKIMTLSKDLVIGKLGELSEEDIKKINRELTILLNLK